MTLVVVDASAGAEIVAGTRRGRALARLIRPEAEGWVPEHFYAEVLAVLRRQLVVERAIDESAAAAAVDRLERSPLHRASVQPLLAAAWAYRHNMTAADAIYVTLAEHLGAEFLTDDRSLANAPTFPRSVNVLTLPGTV